MSDDPSLFGDDKPIELAPVRTKTPIAGWQVDLLRKALDARGLTTMTDRQLAIEVAAERPVESLRALTSEEGMQVLSRLAETAPRAKPRYVSAWDDREADTWIDKL